MLARKKRLTRKEKVELTKERICWKCNSVLEKIGNFLRCEECGNKIVPSDV